jgi:hypothetical protein
MPKRMTAGNSGNAGEALMATTITATANSGDQRERHIIEKGNLIERISTIAEIGSKIAAARVVAIATGSTPPCIPAAQTIGINTAKCTHISNVALCS